MPIPGIETLVDRLVGARADNPAPLESREDLVELIEDMDLLYWNEVELVLADVARRGGRRLPFTKDERLLLDAGVVDTRILEGGPPAKAALLRELYSSADPRFAYFTEWLGARYRTYLRVGRVDEEEGTARRPAPDLRDTRRALYPKIVALLQPAPDVPPRALEMLASGKLDEAIDELGRSLAERPDDATAEKRQKLVDLRARLLAGARERAGPEERALFEALDRAEHPPAEPASPQEPPRITAADRVRFAMGELRMVRSVVKLGIAGSGLARTHSVLVSARERMTRADLAQAAAAVVSADPCFRELRFMIAPYVGTGFYSFDRDLLFVPLISSRSKEDSALNAVAQYRILLDGLNDDGALKQAYEARFGRGDFRADFTRDYKTWVLGVGRGFRGALDPDRYLFFKASVGPQARDVFGPGAILRAPAEEAVAALRTARSRIARDEGTAEDHHRLALAFHRDGRPAEAMEQLEIASRLDPTDGRALFAYGHLLAQAGVRDRARQVLEECEEIAQGTLWGVYASDELQKL